MKRCSRCGQTYIDNDLNFCLNDGELLTGFDGDAPLPMSQGGTSRPFDESPPTIMMDPSRVTSPTAWPPSEPISPWHSQSPNIQQPRYPALIQSGSDQTLPTISLVLGILGFVSVCCWGGIPFGAAALITGYIGMSNADKDSARYGGRGMAIGGMVLGIISFLAALIFIMVGIMAG